MFRNIIKIFKNNFYNHQKYKKNSIVLGRWNLEKDDSLINIKVNNANEDHCGICFYTKK